MFPIFYHRQIDICAIIFVIINIDEILFKLHLKCLNTGWLPDLMLLNKKSLSPGLFLF